MMWTVLIGLLGVSFSATAVMELPSRYNSDSWVSLMIGGNSTTAPDSESREVLNVRQSDDECPPCRCGIAGSMRRIVGGREAEKQKYTWMALLMYHSKPFCGGTLINDRYVLSAAHCTSINKKYIRVRLLEHDLRDTEGQKISVKVSKVIVHKNYNTASLEHDIALFKLADTIDISEKEYLRLAGDEFEDITIRPICLPAPHLDYIGSTAYVTGWGYVRENGPASSMLREVSVPIVSRKECQNGYKSTKITENMVCAGYKKGRKDACQGDSGGPLKVLNEISETYHQVGVVSFGSGCAKANHYGVYTRVNKYLQWIQAHTEDACYCEDTSF